METENCIKTLNTEELIQQLQEVGIDTFQYGKGEAKRIEDLQREITNGESILIKEEGDYLLRVIENIGANIYYISKDNTKYRLKEDKQVFTDGRVRRRDYGHAVSEKKKPEEDPIECAIRGIQEELAIEGDLNLKQMGIEKKKRTSPSYPGLITNYTVYKFEVFLTDEQFRPEGYTEIQDDKTTYFIWEEIGE